jgi:enoyl-[acyl-carrier protein] reductase I
MHHKDTDSLPAVPGNLMAGKKGIVIGVANDKSLAWGITSALLAQGAELALTYQNDVIKKRVAPLAEAGGVRHVLECDVTDEKSLDAVFRALDEAWGGLDFVVHAVAFSDKNELKGRYVDTSADNFANTMRISCYSFTQLCAKASSRMKNGGSMLTLSYHGAQRVMPHYNVMGVAKAALEASVKYIAADLGKDNIRVNAISAGPVKTLAASGIGDFRYILQWNLYNSPLRRNTTLADVGGAAVFLLSDLSSGVTGEIMHVDSGYHVVGMKMPDAPDIAVVPKTAP